MHCHVLAHSLFLICQCTLKDLHLLIYTHSQMQGLVYFIHHGHLSTEKITKKMLQTQLWNDEWTSISLYPHHHSGYEPERTEIRETIRAICACWLIWARHPSTLCSTHIPKGQTSRRSFLGPQQKRPPEVFSSHITLKTPLVLGLLSVKPRDINVIRTSFMHQEWCSV